MLELLGGGVDVDAEVRGGLGEALQGERRIVKPLQPAIRGEVEGDRGEVAPATVGVPALEARDVDESGLDEGEGLGVGWWWW